ncbi:MAG: hypothetical protein ACYDAE_05765 [Steroidobacteraceae bacterium]
MPRNTRRLAGILTAGAALLAMGAPLRLAAEPSRGQDGGAEVWFTSNDDLPRERFPSSSFANHDFPCLFDPNPAWDAKLDGFKISPKMGSTVGPAEELPRINGFLKEHRIALAASVGAIPMDNADRVPGECGFGVEGFNRPGRNAIEFKRLKQPGIDIQYVAMDEPLTFGHFDLVGIANWTPAPSRNPPQSDPDTMTAVLARHLKHGASSAITDNQGPGEERPRDREAHRAEVWLAPQSLPPAPLSRDDDFMQMFKPDAPWKVAAAHTQVFKLYGSFVGHATQAQINGIVADLNRRRIAIALENGVLDVPNTPTPPCGGLGLMEGYGTPEQARRIAGMIKAAGGELEYLDMDEPLYNGHYSNRPHACHSPIKLLLQQLQPTIAAYREVFPDIVIGEAEPTRFPAYAGWQADLKEWLEGVRRILGHPVAYMHLDIPWTDDGGRVPGATLPSHEPADAITFYCALEALRRQHLVSSIGIIEDGTPKDATDAAWVQDARGHLQLLEGHYHLRPDHQVFQSWMAHPSRALPETRPDTLTSLVDWYVDSRRPH